MDSRNQVPIIQTVVSGGLSTCCAKTAAAPLERLRILFQGQNRHYKNLGNGAMMVRTFPHGAVQFLSYEQYKQFLDSLCGKGALSHLLAGSLAGVTACSITYPLDTVRCRLAFQVADEKLYLGIRHTIKKISGSEGGYVALYRGFCAQCLAMIPMIGLSFLTFESMKKYLLSLNETLTRVNPTTGETVLSPTGSLVCGAAAGMISQTIAYPLDVAKRRMQLAGTTQNRQKFSCCLQTLKTVYTEDGVRRGLYRGLSINYLRVVPQVSVMFGVYELSRQLLTTA
ncbi:solute carrier family 25 member 16-like isoform X2 [Porites lutea]|uniref:solute carrier family 25 member 16-like isoform X2 n=1 Tax=Porites lutea TaxID=51062 RepID=UPI003CC6AE0E